MEKHVWTPQLIIYLSRDSGTCSQGLLISITKKNNIQATPQQPESQDTSILTPLISQDLCSFSVSELNSLLLLCSFLQFHVAVDLYCTEAYANVSVASVSLNLMMCPISVNWMNASNSWLLRIIRHLWVISGKFLLKLPGNYQLSGLRPKNS